MTNRKDNDTKDTTGDGSIDLDQIVSPLSTIGDDTTRVSAPVRDEFREIAVNYAKAIQRFQSVRDSIEGHFEDNDIDNAVTYIRGNPRQRNGKPIQPTVSRERQRSVEDTVIATLSSMHNPKSRFYAVNKTVATIALRTLPQAANHLNPTNVGHYVLIGLGKENATAFLPKGTTLKEKIDPFYYFRGDVNSSLVISALEASENQTWYSQVGEWSAKALESVRSTTGQYTTRARAWLESKQKPKRFKACGETHYLRNATIATGIIVALGWGYVASKFGEKKTEWDVAMHNAISNNEDPAAQSQAVWKVIEDRTCQEGPMTVLAGSYNQAAKDVCRSFGEYKGCRDVVKSGLETAANGAAEIDGKFNLTCPEGRK